ncbi:MAG: GNAT family N-acetyltransferase [Bacteroidales bacterium]|nr:GNAT family N-acetyltransferase [Bacteroidales bacterium]
MESVIAPVERALLLDELQHKAQLLRHSRKGGNELYIFTAAQCPNLMREVGRLREETFREAGGGTGLAVDIDEYDTMEQPYWQLIDWDPETQAILGGYRYIFGPDIRLDDKGQPILATSHMFHFSEQFIEEYLPYMLELGRSFVVVDHQSSRAGSKGIFTLDNLWDGLGALAVKLPECRYYYGKFTMYPSYPTHGRNMILYFLQKYFPDPDKLVRPYEPLQTNMDKEQLARIFVGGDFKEDYRILNSECRKLGYKIPPLVNAYMCLSPTMKTFGTAINDEFGDVEESGILITIADIWADKHQRYFESYIEEVNKLADILHIVG